MRINKPETKPYTVCFKFKNRYILVVNNFPTHTHTHIPHLKRMRSKAVLKR